MEEVELIQQLLTMAQAAGEGAGDLIYFYLVLKYVLPAIGWTAFGLGLVWALGKAVGIVTYASKKDLVLEHIEERMAETSYLHYFSWYSKSVDDNKQRFDDFLEEHKRKS